MASFRSISCAPGMAFLLLLASCGGGATEGDTKGADTLTTDDTPKETEILGVGGKFFNVPSPVQTALAIRKAGLKYQKELAAPLEKGDAVTARMAQATLLGVFGADLSYATIHRDGQRSLATLQAIERLGGKLELSNAFDKALIDRFKANMGAEDSLLRFSGVAFRAADQYLKNNEAHDVSAWVLAGGWIESMHLILADPASAGSKELMTRVAEQKGTLDGLAAVVDATNKDGQADALLKGLKELRTAMDGVKMTYTYEQPVTDAGKKTTYINSTSSAELTPEQVAAIAAKVTAIRNMILA
ncbi:MAG: hypothetical protein IPM46_12335 [Flavobacteriales bacterium]|nr:hypothetical protein [Flavobacteriales bacterium]